jgi:ABC-type amino acid transport substrate-binding protein
MLSDAYFQESKKHFAIQKEMEGMLNGSAAQKKVLSSKIKILDMKDLMGKTIASSSSSSNTQKILQKILGKPYATIISSIHVLEVPKDIDALMAINYGVAFAAITTDATLDLLSSINPKQAKQLKRIGGSADAPLPIVAVNKGNASAEHLIDLLSDMNKTTKGKEKLQLLGLDAFSKLDTTAVTGDKK